MWAFLGRRVRTLVIAVVLIPVVGWVARSIAGRQEAKHGGPTTLSRGLRSADGVTTMRSALHVAQPRSVTVSASRHFAGPGRPRTRPV